MYNYEPFEIIKCIELPRVWNLQSHMKKCSSLLEAGRRACYPSKSICDGSKIRMLGSRETLIRKHWADKIGASRWVGLLRVYY